MRSRIFFAIVALMLILGGYFLLFRKNAPAISFWSSNRIEPKSEWRSILVGEWGYKAYYKSASKIENFDGTVEYKADSTFVRYVTANIYESLSYVEVEEKRVNLMISGGGKVAGHWKVGEDYSFTEFIDECFVTEKYFSDNVTNKNFKLCDAYFFDRWIFGTSKGNDGVWNIKTLTNNEIVMEGKIYSSNTLVRCVFKKKK